jgi:YVTN family beta-propeller protein
MRWSKLLLLCCSFGASLLWPADTPRESLLVLSKADHTLAIVDPASLQVVGKAPVGEDPHEVIASSDGSMAYVSNYGGGAYHTLAQIDLAGQKALASIDLGALRGPHGLIFAGGKVWFTAEGAKAIGRYDPASKTVDWILGTGQNRTHMLWVSEDEKRVFTTNVSSGTVSVIDQVARRGPRSGVDWDETIVPVGRGAEGFDVSPDGQQLWTANAQDGTVSIIDIASKKVVDTLQAKVPGANRLKFTPDGKLVFISCLSGAGLAILDAGARKELKRLDVGKGAAGIQMQPDGSRAFVACTPSGYVAVVDLRTLAITAHIDAGPQPDGLAWAVRR